MQQQLVPHWWQALGAWLCHKAHVLTGSAVLNLPPAQAKRGIHSNKEVQTPRVNDVSTPGNGQRAKQYLPFLQRAGKLFGLVESVSSGKGRPGPA